MRGKNTETKFSFTQEREDVKKWVNEPDREFNKPTQSNLIKLKGVSDEKAKEKAASDTLGS